MNEDVADGMVVDLRGTDMMNLRISAQAELGTALDRLLMSNASGNNGFNNSIDLSRYTSQRTLHIWSKSA